MTVLTLSPKEELLIRLFKDRRLAHRVVFGGAHKFATPLFHAEIIDRFHSKAIRNCVEITFRGGAKSTLAEEGVSLGTGFRDFAHCLIVGASIDRGRERLHAVRRHLENNEAMLELFGDLKGRPWTDDMLETNTGITIQAMGRGQSLRGTKSETIRPDLILLDDIEDAESLRTAEGRKKIQDWFFQELLPMGDEPTMRVRILSNDRHPECLANILKAPDSGFEVHVYPWMYRDPVTGQEHSTWPARYSMNAIRTKERQLLSLGRSAEYNQEYMCKSELPEDKPFKKDMFKAAAVARTWQAVYLAFDPARTIKEGSADTGFAAWSWVGPKLVVWDAWGRKLMPDAVVDAVFEENETYHPALIGVDEIGLNEFLMQPLRQRAVKAGVMLPVKKLPAAKSKAERIRALQPFFAAREVEFAKALPLLEAQLQSFPTGKRDVLDALAYALVMRAGAPMYDEFGAQHVMEGLAQLARAGFWLCMNATPGLCSAVLVQSPADGSLRVLADWVEEGDPPEIGPRLVQQALLLAGKMPMVVVPPAQFDKYGNTGLVAALGRRQIEVRVGLEPALGRSHVRASLQRTVKGLPSVMISPEARFTLNGFAGGYCRAVSRGGVLADFAEEGLYRVLAEGVEAFAGLLTMGLQDGQERDINYAYTPDGRRYISARATR